MSLRARSALPVVFLAMELVLASFSANAQVVYEVDPIVVTAERISQRAREALSSLTVITRKEIDAIHAQDLGEVLRLVPGVHIQQYGSCGNLTQMRMRGSESYHLLVMIDGVELNDPFFGGFDIAHLSADAIERVEVVRGTQTALFGADAVGGVVNVFLREDQGGGRFFLSGEAGSLGLRKAVGGLSGTGRGVRYSLNVSHLESDGLSPRDVYRNTGANAMVRIPLARGALLNLGSLYIDYYKELPFAFDFSFPSRQYLDPNNSQSGEMLTAYAEITHEFREQFQSRVRAAVSSNWLRNTDREDIVPVFANTTLNTERQDLEVNERIRINQTASLSLAWQWQAEEASRLDNSSYTGFSCVDEKLTTQSIAASMHYRRGGWLKLMGGVRGDHPSLFESEVSPQARGALRIPSSRTRIRIGWSRGFRVPTLSDLYFPDFGNPSLRPEITSSREAGVDQELFFLDGTFMKKAALNITLFERDVTDLVAFNTQTFQSENIAEAHYSGIEIEFSSLVGQRGIVRLNYTHQRAREVHGDSEFRLERRPKGTFNALIAYRPLRALEVSTHFEAVGDQLDRLIFYDRNGELVGDRVGPYEILNLNLSYRFSDEFRPVRGSEVFLKIRNALDRSYEEIKGYPTPGRTFAVGFTFRR